MKASKPEDGRQHVTNRLDLEAVIGENRQSVTNEPVEVQDCREITDHFRGISIIYRNLIKANRRMSTWNRLDLQTLGSQPAIPQNLLDHWLQMNRLSSRINLLKLEASGNLRIILEESIIEYTSNE